MKKITVGIILLSIFLANSLLAISYDCRDGNYKIVFNIDDDSLHFKEGKNISVMKYEHKMKVSETKRTVVFKRYNALMLATYLINNPKYIIIEDVRSKNTGGDFDPSTSKVMYVYQCKQVTTGPTLSDLYFSRYPERDRNEFLRGCRQGSSQSQCECVLSQLENNIPIGELYKLKGQYPDKNVQTKFMNVISKAKIQCQ